MNNAMAIAVLAGLGGMIGWGAADFFAKSAIDRVGPIKSLVWGHSFGTAFFVLAAVGQLLLGRELAWPAQYTVWLGLAAFGALQMLVYWLVYKGFEKGQLSVLNPVFASFTGLVALISIIFLGEAANGYLVTALITLFIGIILLNIDVGALKSKKMNITPGLPEVAAATVLAAAWTLGWDRFVSGHDALSYALLMYAFMTLAALLLARGLKSGLGNVPTNIWKFLLLMGLGETIAYMAISWGYAATTRTSIVAMISGAFSVPTVVLAYFFLKERLNTLQWAAVAIIILSIVAVASY
jgi:drug/metabolite transporter (DMT)-like permease